MPREFEPSWEDGIRSVHLDEFDSLDRLISDVFFPGLFERQPHVFTPENAGNLRVVVKDGEVVSHIGTIRRQAVIYGCPISVASLGGVATYESQRGHGYATALFEDTMRVCREDGVDIILVSGYRKMYHRLGCRYIGKDWAFEIQADQANTFDDGLEVTAASEADIADLMRVYRFEPVRWVRPPADYAQMIDGWAMNRPARTFLVKDGGHLRSFVVLQVPGEGDDGRVRVLDFAGDRVCLAGALGRLVKDQGLQGMDLHVMGHDRLFGDVLRERGLEGKPVSTSGTMLVIHFAQLMERMRPYFEEVLGEAAKGLVFEEQGDQMIFGYGGDRVVAENRGTAAQIIFGTLDDAEARLLDAGGQAGEVLRKVFPIPGLWCGVNYV
ncbi:MAG: GNAT family N-acetyltransferase [bacterium]|nr:GNAT family N-acetyltransferase [bacterium]